MITRPDRTGPDQNGWAGLGPVQKNIKKNQKNRFKKIYDFPAYFSINFA
jgi:hypothetical protein